MSKGEGQIPTDGRSRYEVTSARRFSPSAVDNLRPLRETRAASTVVGRLGVDASIPTSNDTLPLLMSAGLAIEQDLYVSTPDETSGYRRRQARRRRTCRE